MANKDQTQEEEIEYESSDEVDYCDTLRDRLVWKKGTEWNQGMISGGLGMELDSFFNVFGREEEWNQIIIVIICLWVIEVN